MSNEEITYILLHTFVSIFFRSQFQKEKVTKSGTTGTHTISILYFASYARVNARDVHRNTRVLYAISA
jgi:hypothetical protein